MAPFPLLQESYPLDFFTAKTSSWLKYILSNSQNPNCVAGIFILFHDKKATQIPLVNSLLNKNKRFILVPLTMALIYRDKVPICSKNNFRMGPSLSICITKRRFRFSVTASAPGSHIITQVLNLNTYLVRMILHQLHLTSPSSSAPTPNSKPVSRCVSVLFSYKQHCHNQVTVTSTKHCLWMFVENEGNNDLCVPIYNM